MIKITFNNNKAKIMGDQEPLNKLYKEFTVRHPQAFHIRSRNPHWDGHIHFLTERGYIPTGLLPILVKKLEEWEEEYEIEDMREPVEWDSLSYRLAINGLRDYQVAAVKSIVLNRLGNAGIPFHRGIVNAATNAGKTHIIMSLFNCFYDIKGLILLNNSQLFDQFLQDMPKFFPNPKDWGYLRGKQIRWGNLMVVMVQSLVKNLDRYPKQVSEFQAVFVDECDLSDNKTYKKVLEKLYNTTIRVGLSGSIFTSTLAKDKLKNTSIKTFLGEEVYRISNKELISKKISVPIIVKINNGNMRGGRESSYAEFYNKRITNNTERNTLILERIKYYLRQEIKPILVMCQYHEHVDILYQLIRDELPDEITMGKIYHSLRDKETTLTLFKKGSIDVLISSLLIKRGQNMPLVKVIINASAGDSMANVLQIVGRGTRTHSSKTKTYIEDFYDFGVYLESHSKHRLLTYKKEEFKIIKLG